MAELKRFNLEKQVTDTAKKATLKTLDEEGIVLGQELQGAVNDYAKLLDGRLENAEGATEAIDRLNNAISHGKKYEQNIAKLTAGLTAEYQELSVVFSTAQSYRGLEKFLAKIGLKGKANELQYKRVESQDVRENLQELLSYGALVCQKVGEHIETLVENEGLMQKAIEHSDQVIEESQEQYDQWNARYETLGDQLATLRERMQSGEGEYAVLVKEETELQQQYKEAEENKMLYFTRLERTKQARPTQQRQIESIRNIYGALNRFKVQIETDLEGVTNVYLTTPDNIKAALATKGAEDFDKAKNAATQASLEATVLAEKAILDVTATRAERQLIEPEVLEAITTYHKKNKAEFDGRMKNLEAVDRDYKPV